MAIQAENLYKSFGSRTVLSGLSLAVPRGQAVAVVGASGRGKSVLLKHPAGLLRPDRGTLRLDQLDIVHAGRPKLASLHRKIGFLFQDGGLLNSMNVFDNLALPLRESGKLRETEIRGRMQAVLARVGVVEAATKFPPQLSGGMRKRAGLARALIEGRSFFFFDEPTSALDPVTAAGIRGLIREVYDQWKATTLVVTHDLRLARKMARRIAFLDEGRLRMSGSFEDLSHAEDPVVRRFFDADSRN